jgi:threonine aldolase
MKNHHKLDATFASDNAAGVHPTILKAINGANQGHVIAYGDDPHTDAALKRFRQHFGENTEVYFVFGGTGANVLALKAVTEPYQAIICADKAHINVDECGAPEKFTGCKLLPVSSHSGKISIKDIQTSLTGVGDEHHVQPGVISISQSTEMGTVYTRLEIKALATFAHKNKMLLHMDGARIANAAVSQNATLREITSDVGVDILSFGGAKNGMMYGEAVLFFNKRLSYFKREFSEGFKYTRKQGAQLPSKMRFISAQFEALLSNYLWKKNAAHANHMAQILAFELSKIPGIGVDLKKVQANAVFAIVPKRCVELLQKQYYFYVWDEDISQVRLMTSFATTPTDIGNFIALVKRMLGRMKRQGSHGSRIQIGYY